MFGVRLKSWMEAHLGRPRHKSTTHQSQKKSSKDSTNTVTTSTANINTTGNSNNAATTSSLSSTSPTAANNSRLSHLDSGDCPPVKNPNFESITDFSSSSSSSHTVSANFSSPGSEQLKSSTQILKGVQEEEEDINGLDHPAVTSDQQLLPNRNIVTVSNSSSILLGSFSNNLSSPDTGYSSTDGCSPKSVYPALSFEFSGKSTPKSSYTISSLVSSERLNKNTPSPTQSQSFSVQNELEQDECVSPPPPVNNPVLPCPKGESSSSLQLQIQSASQSQSTTDTYSQHSLFTPKKDTNSNVNSKLPVIVQDGRNTSDNGAATSFSSQLSHSLLSNQSENNFLPNTISNIAPSIVISGMSTRPVLEGDPGSSNKNRIDEFSAHLPSSLINSSLPMCSHQLAENNQEKMVVDSVEEPDGSQIANSSSTVTARSIRTSLALSAASAAAATTRSDSPNIADCNGSLVVGIKNSFSLSSPRRERTRIKTNPWITISHHNDSNSHANNNNSNEQGRCSVSTSATPGNSDTESGSASATGVSSDHSNSKRASGAAVSSTDSPANHTGVSGGETSSAFSEINKRAGEERDTILVGVGGDHDSQMLYRISTSTSASDSGKGTLEPGTNRNSTESSCLLSGSTSTRNSIISHENGSPCSVSGSSVNGNGNNTSNTHGHENGLSFTPQHQNQHQHSSSSASQPNAVSTPSSSVISTPVCISNNRRLNSSSAEPKSEDNTTNNTSVTFTELIGKYDESSYPNMVDKETDILSDWANTDEDGEDEIETDQNDNDTVTPTPSSPDTGGRIVLTTSQSNSSATDLDFIDTSHRHYTQNINKHPQSVSGTAPPPIPSPYHHNMNLPTLTTCYPAYPSVPLQIPIQMATEIPEAYAYAYDTDIVLNQSDMMANHIILSHPPTDASLKTARCFNTRITNVSPPPHPSKPPVTNTNSSHAIARGALGFLRKIFKKGSCSSQRTSPGSGKVKMSRGRGASRDNNNLPDGLRSPILADIENYPLSNTKPLSPAINGYFLTPTPNSFRRRSGTGTDSSDSRNSKQHKGIKTDIIRLPGPALSLPSQSSSSTQSQAEVLSQQQQSFSSTSSSATNHSRSSHSNSNRNSNPPLLSPFIGPNAYSGVNVISVDNGNNSNTNSTSGSSVQCMSTSTSASGGIGIGPSSVHTSSQMRNNDSSILNSNMQHQNSSLKEPCVPSSQHSQQHQHQQRNSSACIPDIPFTSSAYYNNPTMSPAAVSSNVNGNAKLISCQPSTVVSNQSQIIVLAQNTHLARDILSGAPSSKIVLGAGGHCSYETQSPRLQNNSTRINSPSFNNYSPIHRLVVTGGNHLLNRGGNAPSTSAGASSSFHTGVTESPLVISRNGNVPLVNQHHHLNNTNTSCSPNFTPNSQIINRPVVSTSSPLINHRHSISSPHPPHHSFAAGGCGVGTGAAPPFTSPSPILRNPRYQYITSSNQNSPVLNVPKRINIPLHHSQNAYPHPGIPNGLGGSPMISFSPAPPVPHHPPQRNNSFSANNNHNHQVNASPNLNSSQHPLQRNRNRSGSQGCDFDYEHRQQQQQQHPIPPFHNSQLNNGSGNGNIPSSSVHVPLNQSHSFCATSVPQQNHYYSSPVIPQRNLVNLQHPHNGYSVNNAGGGGSGLPTSAIIGESGLSEAPQAITQRYHQSCSKYPRKGSLTNPNDLKFPLSSSAAARSMPMSPQERIYETVDSDDDDVYVSDEGDGNGGEFEFDMSLPYSPEELYRHSKGYSGNSSRSSAEYIHQSYQSNASLSQSQSHPKFQHNSKSKRSKKSFPVRPAPQPQPPARKVPTNLPMMLGTYLSETETRLLEDRKYKQLINEAEALLKEISIEKYKPWNGRPDTLMHEDCPQSDPLRRKAYDCWALRRLQQELAGCCASPPVLHRSRLNLTSPSSPNASSHPYFNNNLSLVQVHSDAAFMNALIAENANRNITHNSNF